MSSTIPASEFAKSALALDRDFSELDELSGQIDRLSIETESGLERAQQLLLRFGECGERIAVGVQALAKSLDQARTRAEQSAQIVAARAAQIHERHQESQRILGRFQALGEKVRGVTVEMAVLKKPAGADLSDEERATLPKRLAEFESQLDPLIEEARALKEDARNSKMKSLERNADSLAQSLEAARRKLASPMSPQPEQC